MSGIGIMGGTFDPIHIAHLEMARCAMEQKQLREIWFMPSKIPPHKQERKILSEDMRAEMIQLAIQEESGFLFSDFELRRKEITYTARTLELLEQECPKEKFYFILGGDSLFQFEHWYHPEEILQRAVVLAIGRNGVAFSELQQQASYLSQRYHGRVELVQMPRLDISSSMIRRKIAQGESVKEYLPSKVYQYIVKNHCYQ